MDFERELSVKGFCFRGYKDNATVAEKVKACGLERIDLSGPQVAFRDASVHDAAIQTYTEAGVQIVGIGVVQLHGDADDERYFEFCRKAGCRTISVSGQPASFLDALKQAERWAEAYDMVLAIHNHGGKDWLGNSKMLQHVLDQSGPRVGLCIDTAWCIQSGESPLKWVELFGERVLATHFKDFVFDRKGKYEDVIVGEGALDLPAYVSALQSVGFNGPAIIEFEGDVDNPVPSLSKCVASMRAVLRSVAAPA